MTSVSRISRSLFRILSTGGRRGVGPCPKSISGYSYSAYVQSRNLSSSSLRLSQSNKEIHDFLIEEISAEKSSQKTLPSMGEFTVEKSGAELKLSRPFGQEKVVITLNVNHTVDSAVPEDDNQEASEMKSKPNFEVDIIRSDNRVLSFSCSYIPDADMDSSISQSDNQIDDIFAIDEVTFSTSLTPSDNDYAVAGDILDGYLYDLFMNMLDERGINSAFVESLSSYCSSYEHTLYIQMLEEIKNFVKS